MKHKLLLIDGISGSGKSTTAQYIDLQLKLNGLDSLWYHEEEDGHPLEYTPADIETMHTAEKALVFKDAFLDLARDFVVKSRDGRVHIIESYYLQDCVRILFQNNVDESVITAFFKDLNDIFSPMEPAVIYFRHDDVFRSIRNIWETRGEDWKNWFVEADGGTPYVLARGLAGEEAALTLWRDYQELTDRLLEQAEFPVARVNCGDTWEQIYGQIIRFLNITRKSMPVLSDSGYYTGTFAWQSGEETHECQICLRNDQLVTNLIWGERRLIFDGDDLMLESFPYNLEFSRNDGESPRFTVTGKRAGRFWGRTYIRTGPGVS